MIEYSDFCQAIARAICPADERPIEGIDCVVGTRAKHGFVAPQSQEDRRGTKSRYVAPTDEAGRAIDQLNQAQGTDAAGVSTVWLDPWQSEVEEIWLPFALTDSERRWLVGLLPQLPPLRYPMSDDESGEFLDAYRRLEKRPAWEPVLLTAVDMERRKAKQAMVLARHRRALRDEFAGGRMVAVDSRHVPVSVLTMGGYIPRAQAIAYLERCGLAHDGNDAQSDTWHIQRRAVPGHEGASAPMPRAEQTRGITEPFHAMPKIVGMPTGTTASGRPRQEPRPESAGGADHTTGVPRAVERQSIGKVARLRRVMELTGLGRSSIYNRMDLRSAQYDPTFPRSFPLGANGGAVGWDEDAVKAWVLAQASIGRV
ncbi:AlpA family phage regulatory protein [Cupriavidus sp. KK10]|uniref:AlpA family phage regulatory protein n=1 Tax=Cupriavidus sp. KK10 TaxID=1478019 RepID=UPI001BA907BB|nr:AlpA family phage regulatory protein [Cupriavidus sp. KK10]QUN27223.1 AlpA family phage regulatory protein [Cupriavidus sp. KK10]